MSRPGEECEEKNTQHMEQYVKTHGKGENMGGRSRGDPRGWDLGVLERSWRGGQERRERQSANALRSQQRDCVSINHDFYIFVYFMML